MCIYLTFLYLSRHSDMQMHNLYFLTTKQIITQLPKTEKVDTAYIAPQKHYVDAPKSPNETDIKKQIDDLFDKVNSR